MSDLTRGIESVSRYGCWVLFSLVYAFALWFIGFILAHEGWLAGFGRAQFTPIALPILGIALALGRRGAASILFWVFAIGMLILDGLLLVTSLLPNNDDSFGSFNSAPLLTIVWIVLWIAPQILAIRCFVEGRKQLTGARSVPRNRDC